MLDNLQPANLTVGDMIGTRINYVYAAPYGYPPQIETGKVISVKQAGNVLYMEIQPHNPCLMTKWRSEFDFVSYAYNKVTAA